MWVKTLKKQFFEILTFPWNNFQDIPYDSQFLANDTSSAAEFPDKESFPM